jgi:glycosyltransferase involved in cell wall biosynthesis
VKPLLLLPPGTASIPQYRTFLGDLSEDFQLETLPGPTPGPGPLKYLHFAKTLRSLEKRGVQLVLVPTADKLLKFIGLARLLGFPSPRLQVRVSVNKLKAAYPGRSPLRSFLDRIEYRLERLAPARRFYSDEFALERVLSLWDLREDFIPDPPLSMETLRPREMRDLPRDPATPLLFGCLGGLARRKGIPQLLEAFRGARFRGKPRMLLAGRLLDPSISEAIHRTRADLGADRLELREGFLDDVTYRDALKDIDVICLPYTHHVGPSGIFPHAAAAGKVLVVPDYGWLGWYGRRYPRALLFQHGSTASLQEVLQRAEEGFEELRSKPADFTPFPVDHFTRTLCGF